MRAWILALVLLCAAAGSLHQPFHSLEDQDADALWEGFKHRFNRSYAAEEEPLRRRVFSQNLHLVDAMNRAENATVFGITRFSDISTQEFKALYLSGYVRPLPLENAPVLPPATGAIPSAMNWATKGATTPVYNQGQCGSCWAFSATEQVESMAYLLGTQAGSPQKLSMQQIVDCDTHGQDQGCNGGDTPTAYQYIMNQGGLVPLSDYPYTAEDGTCAFHPAQVSAVVKSWAYVAPPSAVNETAMLQYVGTTAPISICVDAASWQFYFGGIIRAVCGQSLDHCVQLVGYATDDGVLGKTDYWIVRNSWGAGWGESGFVYVERGYNLCGIADEPTTVVAAYTH